MNQHDIEEQSQRNNAEMMDSNGNIDIMMGKLEVGGVGGEDASPSPTEASTTDIVSSGMPKSSSSQQKRNKLILMSAIVISGLGELSIWAVAITKRDQIAFRDRINPSLVWGSS